MKNRKRSPSQFEIEQAQMRDAINKLPMKERAKILVSHIIRENRNKFLTLKYPRIDFAKDYKGLYVKNFRQQINAVNQKLQSEITEGGENADQKNQESSRGK